MPSHGSSYSSAAEVMVFIASPSGMGLGIKRGILGERTADIALFLPLPDLSSQRKKLRRVDISRASEVRESPSSVRSDRKERKSWISITKRSLSPGSAPLYLL